jgi:hypothetical protein
MKKIFLFTIFLMCPIDTLYGLNVVCNSFKYKNLLFHSEIRKYRFNKNGFISDLFEITYYYENEKKWLNLKIEPVFQRDYFANEIVGPVYEWNRKGKLLTSNKDSISIAKDTFRIGSMRICGLSPELALSGSLTGWEFNPDSAMTINTVYNCVILTFNNKHQPITRINIWQKNYHSNIWSFAGNYPMVGNLFSRSLCGKIKVGYYFEFNTSKKIYSKPNAATMPMLLVNFY